MLLRQRSYVALALLCLAACRTPARREEHARTPSPIVRVGSSIETIAADGRGVIVGGVDQDHALLARIVDGEPVWQWRSVEASASVTALTLDDEGVVAIGRFGKTLTLGEDQLVGAGMADCFVARFDVAHGEVRRAIRIGGSGEELCRSVVAHDHALYVAGSFSDRITLGSTSYTSRGSKDMFVALLSRELDVTRATQLGGRGNDLARGLAVDAQGGVVLVGQFGGEIELADGAVDFGEGPIASRGDFDAVVAYLDATGRPRWGRSLGGAGFDVAKTVRIEADGEIYVVGSLDRATTPPKTPDDWRLEGFLARYSARGEQRWLRRPANVTSLHSLVLDPRGGVDVIGHFTRALSQDDCHATSVGENDVLFARFGSDGRCLAAAQLGSAANDYGYAIAIAAGTIIGAGTWDQRAATGFVTTPEFSPLR